MCNYVIFRFIIELLTEDAIYLKEIFFLRKGKEFYDNKRNLFSES